MPKNCRVRALCVPQEAGRDKRVTIARINRLLDSVKIEDVIGNLLGDIEKKGENHICTCPWCGSHHTMAISNKHQIYTCFACGKSGNVINFVMDFSNKNYTQAVTYLERNFSKIKYEENDGN